MLKRIEGLEELQKRLLSNSIQNIDACVDVLLKLSVNQGGSQPESSLIIESLLHLIREHEETFEKILNSLKLKQERLFVVVSQLILRLDHEKQKRIIKPFIDFIASRDSINGAGVSEVFDSLMKLGEQSLSTEIVKESSEHLGSLRTCAILFSVKLCSEFADKSLLTQMTTVLDKSMKGYYAPNHIEIERSLLKYFRRIKDPTSFPRLVSLLKLRLNEYPSEKSDALSEILNSHPYLADDLLDTLYDARNNKELVTELLSIFEKMEKPPSATVLLPKLHIRYWWESQARFYLKNILVKGGESSKPALFEMSQDSEKFEYALECLKEIGVTSEELPNLFGKPPMLKLYNFLHSQSQGKKMPKDLNTLWIEKEELGKNVPGTTNRFEHLFLHIFSSFNLVTLNVAPLKLESVDIVGFFPESLDLLIVGCTTGVLKDDLAKMDALVEKMKAELPDLFDTCTVTPVVVSSKVATISQSDAKYASTQEIVILQDHDIDKLLEMLTTNRETKKMLSFIQSCKGKYVQDSGGYYN
jgi:hypothetical protein